MEDRDKKYPEGHFVSMWMRIGIAIFSGMGIPLSIITNNYGFIGIGPAIGVALGLSIGQAVENKYKEDGKIRSLTEDEKKGRKNAVMAGVGIVVSGVILFPFLLLLNL